MHERLLTLHQLAGAQPEIHALAAHVKQLEATISRMQVDTICYCLMLSLTIVTIFHCFSTLTLFSA